MVVLLKKEPPFRGIFKVWEAVLAYAQKSLHIGIFENAGFGWACRGLRSSPHGDGGTLTDAILYFHVLKGHHCNKGYSKILFRRSYAKSSLWNIECFSV